SRPARSTKHGETFRRRLLARRLRPASHLASAPSSRPRGWDGTGTSFPERATPEALPRNHKPRKRLGGPAGASTSDPKSRRNAVLPHRRAVAGRNRPAYRSLTIGGI